MKNLPLHWKILIGMALGVLFGVVAVNTGLEDFTRKWIMPWGKIFLNLLKLIAVPLILASLIKGISDLKDISKLSQIGGRTLAIYVATTITAVIIGLLLVNIIQPGSGIAESTRTSLMEENQNKSDEYQGKAKATPTFKEEPLRFIVDMVPDNIVGAAASNRNMLQVIFFAIFFGIAMILVKEEKVRGVKDFFDGFNDIILKMVDLVILAAPYGVFALLAGLVVTSPSADIFIALGKYAFTLVLGLAVMIGVYAILVAVFTGKSPGFFFRGIAPAQLLAFSTSSSAATLPVTMERVEEHLGVEKEVVSFVLPIGATVNMDGTSVYQAVAAVFIAQVYGFDLTFMDQITIVFTATLASIGSAAVPSAGIVMLVIVLESIGVPPAGIALIFAVDRPLDMCRTVVNVTGDAAVSMIVAKSVGKLGEPKVQNWDDNYEEVA